MTIARTICLGFLAVIAVGTVLLLLPFSTSTGTWNDPIVALFTATSAVCVTGLAVVDTGGDFSGWGQFFIVLLIQVGGLGYMMTTTFLMLLLGRKFDFSQKLAISDSFDRPFLQGSQTLVRSILATTLVVELTGVFLLFNVFRLEEGFENSKALGYAIFHSISAWNNAGFSLFSDSLVRYQSSWAMHLIIPGLIILGGIGYQVIIEFYYWVLHCLKKNKLKFTFSLNFKIVTVTTFLLLFGGTIAFFSTEVLNPNTLGNLSFQDKFLAAWFQSVTTRTAGFNTIDLGQMSSASLFLTIGFMFVGASPSGTGGGIKTTTLSILANCTKSILLGKEQVVMYKRTVPFSLILKAVGVVFGSLATIGVTTTLLSLTDPGIDFLPIFFEAVSAFATVGLSTGITAAISPWGQLVLIGTMYIGRVGILLLMAAILGDPQPCRIQYPEENLLVG